MAWWVDPLTQAAREGRLGLIVFDLQGIAPIGYTLFAVALGIFAGTVWQRMLPAMGVTLVAFIGVRAAVAILARPHYQPARTLTFPIEGTASRSWSAATGSSPRASATPTGRWWRRTPGSCARRAARGRTASSAAPTGPGPGAYNWQLYQPADRFWLFQGIETGIFVALAVLLLYLAVRRLRRIA